MWNVVWGESAMDELGRRWTAASSQHRQAITEAAAELDRLLGQDPLQQSESREAGERIIIVPPHAALYRIDETSQMVRVGHVWTFHQRH
jgi:hypothetical protein